MFNRRNFLKGGAALGAFAATTGLSLRAARAEEAMRLFWFGSPARAERTLVIDLGQVVFDGDPKEAVGIYRDLMFGRASQGATA